MKVFWQVHRGAWSLLYVWEDRYMHYLGTLGSISCIENANLSCGNAITWHCVASENQRKGVKLESKDLVTEGRGEWDKSGRPSVQLLVMHVYINPYLSWCNSVASYTFCMVRYLQLSLLGERLCVTVLNNPRQRRTGEWSSATEVRQVAPLHAAHDLSSRSLLVSVVPVCSMAEGCFSFFSLTPITGHG